MTNEQIEQFIDEFLLHNRGSTANMKNQMLAVCLWTREQERNEIVSRTCEFMRNNFLSDVYVSKGTTIFTAENLDEKIKKYKEQILN